MPNQPPKLRMIEFINYKKERKLIAGWVKDMGEDYHLWSTMEIGKGDKWIGAGAPMLIDKRDILDNKELLIYNVYLPNVSEVKEL